jgi:hypothetical protein
MGTLRVGTVLVGLVLAAGWAESAWAWGDLGHTTVCEIAFQELDDTLLARGSPRARCQDPAPHREHPAWYRTP